MYSRLNYVRTNANMSQEELARAAGVSQSIVSKIERGTLLNPASDKLRRLAEVLGCDVREFIDETASTDTRAMEVAQRRIVVSSMKTNLPMIGLFENSPAMNFSETPVKIVKGKFGETMTQRPPWLIEDDEAYAMVQRGTEMEPRFRKGEILYASPCIECKDGDDVIIHLKADGEVFAICRHLVAKTDEKFVLKQYSPEKESHLCIEDVECIHSVCGVRNMLNT